MRRIYGILLLLLIMTVGCSDQKQVKGKVFLSDGKPLTVGQVVFENNKFSATGEIQKDGSYVLGAIKPKDGIPIGEYTVYITHAMKITKNDQSVSNNKSNKQGNITIPSFEPIIAKKYTSISTSNLKCKVEKSMTFDITVEPYQL